VPSGHAETTFGFLDPKVTLRALQKEASRERAALKPGCSATYRHHDVRIAVRFYVSTLFHPSGEESGASAWMASMRVVSSIVKAKSAPNAAAGVSAPGAIPLAD
jgi:hypothetical protein